MAAITDLAAEVGLRTWIARPRTDRVAIFRTSASKTPNAGAEAADSVEIASAAVADSAEVIDLGVVPLAEGAALVDLAVAAEVDGSN